MATVELLAMVPNAAPMVPNFGIRMTLKQMVRIVIETPSRSGVWASPAARKAPLSMKNIIMPKMPMNMARRNGSASCCTSGAALMMSRSAGAAEVADGREHHGQAERRQEGLIDDAVDSFGLVRARKPRDQDAHPGEHRAQEHDNDEDDLPAVAEGGVAPGADEVADHGLIDHPLKSGDDVLQHGRPRNPPDGGTDGTIDDRAIEGAEFRGDLGHWNGHLNSSGQVKTARASVYSCRHTTTLRSQPMRLSRERTVLVFCLHACLLVAAPARAQNWSFDARNVGLGGIGSTSNIALDMIDEQRPYKAIVLPFGLLQVLPNLPKLDPGSDEFDLVRTIEYSVSPIHYIVGRDATSTASAFITDLRNGELNRDLTVYRGFSPQTSVVAEGLGLAKLGTYVQVPSRR